MNKKAQIQQVFIYIMAIIVIGFLVLFSYRMIDRLFIQKCSVEEQSFYTSIKRDLEANSRYGERDLSTLTAPCEYNKLCLVDKQYFEKGGPELPPPYSAAYPLIAANTKGDSNEGNIKVQYNIYLFGPKTPYGVPLFYDETITTVKETSDPPLICVESRNGQFSFWIEGLGKGGVYVHNRT